MDLTTSYSTALPAQTLARYEAVEVRNGAGVLSATNPDQLADIVTVLDDFELLTEDLVKPGGNESKLAARLNKAFRARGWRESRVDTRMTLALRRMPYRPAGEKKPETVETEVFNEGFKVDNILGRVALDVEWNAKDGNLDRNLSAYRALYEHALIDCAVIITRTTKDLQELGQRLRREAGLPEEEVVKVLATSTTTNFDKLIPRLTRGDSGGCPVLAIGICARTWEDAPSVTGVP